MLKHVFALPSELIGLRQKLLSRVHALAGIGHHHFERHAACTSLITRDKFFRDEDEWAEIIDVSLLRAKTRRMPLNDLMMWLTFIEQVEYVEHVAKWGSTEQLMDAAYFAGVTAGLIEAHDQSREEKRRGAETKSKTARDEVNSFIELATAVRAKLRGRSNRHVSKKEAYHATVKRWQGEPPIGLKAFWDHTKGLK
jgi:hypothetical protein